MKEIFVKLKNLVTQNRVFLRTDSKEGGDFVKEIFVNIEKCLGCKSCELACAIEHSQSKSLFGILSESPIPRNRVFVEYGDGKKVPLQCRHCQEAPCIDACISGAMKWDNQTNLVAHDKGKCVGCWMCIMVCPFGVIGREKESKVALKCDRCHERDEPACVEACPTHALLFKTLEEAEKLKRKGITEVL